MLRPSIDAYLALRRAVGFQLQTEERLLHDFAHWALARGDTHVQTQTATEWAAAARSIARQTTSRKPTAPSGRTGARAVRKT